MDEMFVVKLEVPVRASDEEQAVHKVVLALSDRMTDSEIRGHVSDVTRLTEVKDASTV